MAEYATLKEKIQAEKAEKLANQTTWKALVEDAILAGATAGADACPAPMVVGTPVNVAASLIGGDGGGFNTDKPVYYVSEGVCGFAWVKFVATGTAGRKFVNYLTGHQKPATSELAPPITLRKSYNGGHDYWVSGFGQSMQRKEACARAMARVIADAGIEGLSVYSQSRMD